MPKTTRVLLLSFLIALCFQHKAFSQTNKNDSVSNLISSSPDSAKLSLILQISKSYMDKNNDSIIFYADKALLLAKDQNNKASIASALNLKGVAALYQSEYNISIDWYTQSLEIAFHLQDSLRTGATYNNIGLSYMYQAKYNKAIEYFKKALYYKQQANKPYKTAINQDRNKKIAEMEISIKKAKKEADLDKAALENKLQEQKLNEENFQLIAILSISIITVAFVIIFYYLRSKQNIADKFVQDLQAEALKERLFELQLKHEGTEKTIDIIQINQDLQSPLTELEIETLHLSLEGLPNNEIAEKLLLSITTVKFHLRNIYKKLRVKGKTDVINYIVKSS